MASLKEFIANSKSFISGITGKALWSDAPAMTLEQVTARIKAILGKDDQFADPDIDLTDTSSQIAAIIGLTGDDDTPDITLHEASEQIKAIIGLTGDDSTPDITLHEASGQIKAIIGLTGDDSTPGITLAGAKTHVDASVVPSSSPGTAHGITGMNATPVALGTASKGGDTTTTISRSDHVHPTTGLMTTGHVANNITGFATSAAALGTSYGGTATTVSRGDHVHAMPSASDVGALASSSHPHSNYNATISATGANFISNITVTNGITTAVSTRALTRNDISAAYIGGSSTQEFSAKNIITPTAVAIKSSDGSSAFAFNTSGSDPYRYRCQAINWNGFESYLPGFAGFADMYMATAHYNGLDNYSDERLKKNIRSIEANEGIKFVRDLKPDTIIRYELKNEHHKGGRLGFSAQKLREALPSIVSEHPPDERSSTSILSFDPTAILALAVDAIRVLDARLTAMEAAGRGKS